MRLIHVRRSIRACLYKKNVSKFPSFPRAHHPIIRDSTSICMLTGLDLVQLGNRSFRDSFCQVCKSRLLAAVFFQSRLFSAEVRNLPTISPDLSDTARSSRNRFRNPGSLRKIFVPVWSCWNEFIAHIARFWSSVVDSSFSWRSINSFLSTFVLPPLSGVISTIQATVTGEGRRDVSIYLRVLRWHTFTCWCWGDTTTISPYTMKPWHIWSSKHSFASGIGRSLR
jgi:hypothetical protein